MRLRVIEASSKAMLCSPVAEGHFVQFYASDEPRLVTNACVFLGQGLRNGDAALVVSTLGRWASFARALEAEEISLDAAVSEGRAAFVNAADLIRRVTETGEADYEVFEQVIGGAIRSFRKDDPEREVRAYGDAVGLLWSAGRPEDAETIELFWIRLRKSIAFTLLCGYPIDIYDDEFFMDNVDAVLCNHTHMLPSCDEFRTENALRRAMHEVLGARAEGLRKLMKANYRPSWGALPRVEASILWLRNNLPDLADSILERARRNAR